MTEIKESFLSELDTWTYKGINIGEAVRKQILPDKLPEVEVDDGTRDGRQILFTKPYCPDCEEVSYSGRYCQNCGRRLRK